MKLPVHAISVDCKQRHIKETYDIKNVTCLACKTILRTDKEIAAQFNFLADREKSTQKLRIKNIDVKIFEDKLQKQDIMSKHESVKIVSCIKCGGSLKKRQNSKTNQYFMACVNYPKCKFTINRII
jgi:hypothetical protein